METGTVKFHYECDGVELTPFAAFEELNAARRELARMGLLGVDENGIGFGNVSARDGADNSFYVTGSGTGGLSDLGLEHYAKVTAWDFDRNWLHCQGRTIPSAESLSHAAVYATAADVRAVAHGHDPALWHWLCERGSVTAAHVAYGTPEMAREVMRLFLAGNVRQTRIFAMAGHIDGIVAFGSDLRQVINTLTTARNRARP